MKYILLILFTIALKCRAEDKPKTVNHSVVPNVSDSESFNASTTEATGQPVTTSIPFQNNNSSNESSEIEEEDASDEDHFKKKYFETEITINTTSIPLQNDTSLSDLLKVERKNANDVDLSKRNETETVTPIETLKQKQLLISSTESPQTFGKNTSELDISKANESNKISLLCNRSEIVKFNDKWYQFSFTSTKKLPGGEPTLIKCISLAPNTIGPFKKEFGKLPILSYLPKLRSWTAKKIIGDLMQGLEELKETDIEENAD